METDDTVEQSPPCKKACTDENLPDFFLLEELSNVLGVCPYRQELGVVNQELDLLDDIHVSCVADLTLNDIGQVNKSEFAPCNFVLPVDQMCNNHYSVYIPPREEEHILQPTLTPEDLELPPKEEAVSTCPAIAIDAKQEASVLQQVSFLHKKGLWSPDRLPKVMEPRCGKLHHVHLLNEALWLSTDFSEERKWKKEIASKLARAAQVYLITRHEWNQQFQHFEEQLRMRNAARVAKIVKDWWNGVHQNLNVLRMKLYHKRWEHACKENQGSVAHFSDMGPSWLGAINYDLEDDGFHESDIPQSLHDERILSHVDGDADVDDKDWKPDVEYDGTIKLDSSSRSTSSSLAASFMDDSDTSGLGVAVYSSPDHLSPEYHSPEISSTCLTACYQEKKTIWIGKKTKDSRGTVTCFRL
ncbi:unnamed protein product [Heterobilharzia americana]|nr:unnamed protein product [Heterobilharzia americana]